MQHNTTEKGATPATIFPENNPQQPSTNLATGFLARATNNRRFAVTPETMGLNLCSDTPRPTREQTRHEPPLVDVKSYQERHNKLSEYNEESTASFHSSHSNTPTNSYVSIRTENVGQRTSSCFANKTPSPNASPKTPSQQWSFDPTNKPEYLEQQKNVYTSSASLCPTQSARAYVKYPASSNLHTLKSPDTLPFEYMPDIPITYFNEEHHQKYRSGSDVCVEDSAKLNYNKLNKLYSKRIEDIDANVWGDKELKIETYKEWVEMLTKTGVALIINMDNMEKEVSASLELLQRKVNGNCRHSQGNELMKCRKDIDTLLKYIKNAHNCKSWDLQGFTFETITPAQVLDAYDFDNLTIEGNGGDAMKNNEAEIMHRNKLYANMKALAYEVAEKHDEVRELKRQVISMEDEIQKAQQKIQLKDDVIKELRNDLKCANNKFSAQHSEDPGLIMPPINFEDQTSCSTQQTVGSTPRFQNDNGTQFDFLSHTELEEQQKLKEIKDEMNDFFEKNKELNKHNMEKQSERLMTIVQKLDCEKTAANRKLDFIRSQLIDLEVDSAECYNDCDSGFDSKSKNDKDAKLLDAVRKRLRKLNDTNEELKKRMQKLELENSELSNSLHSEKSFSQRNSETLKEIADLLCRMKGKQFSYTDIYNTTAYKINPFCEAIEEMKKDFQDRESQLLTAVTIRNHQVEELEQSLLKNEKDINEERILHMKDINITPTTLTATSLHQPLPVTSSISTSPPPSTTTTLSTSLTVQQIEPATAASLQGFTKKKSCV